MEVTIELQYRREATQKPQRWSQVLTVDWPRLPVVGEKLTLYTADTFPVRDVIFPVDAGPVISLGIVEAKVPFSSDRLRENGWTQHPEDPDTLT